MRALCQNEEKYNFNGINIILKFRCQVQNFLEPSSHRLSLKVSETRMLRPSHPQASPKPQVTYCDLLSLLAVLVVLRQTPVYRPARILFVRFDV